MTLSDRVAVMNAGRFEQVGSPADVYERPKTPFVRDFLGQTIQLPGQLWIRPEDLIVNHRNGGAAEGNSVDGVIETLLFVGERFEARIKLGTGDALLLPLSRSGGFATGEAVRLTWLSERAQRWPD